MADALVPYGDTRIVLRHNNSVVLYDSNSRRVVARNTAEDDRSLDFSECPTCGRPYHYGAAAASAHQDDFDEASAAAAVTGAGARGNGGPEYFRMLAGSLPDAPPSPVRQLAQPVRSPSSSASSTEPLPSRRARPSSLGPHSPVLASGGATAAATPNSTGIDPSAFSEGYFNRFFVSEGELGRGGKGVVLLARHVIDRVDLGRYAVKRIPVGNDHQWLVKILAEVQLLSNLAHENLVQYKHVWLEEVKITTFGPSVPCAFVLQMFCNGGDLHRFICGGSKGRTESNAEMKEKYRRRNSKIPEDISIDDTGLRRLSLDEIYSFFKQITAGISYLHENDYVHRDLKPSNCLLHDTGHELKVLVSDFGEVQMGDQIREGTGATGTISYCAPEVLKLDVSTGALGAFTFKSDVFSLGMVLHFLCFGQLPYHSADGIDEDDEDVEQLKDEISRWSGFEDERHIRSDLPDQLYQHLSRLLSTNPGHRPSAADILAGLEHLGVSGRISGGRAGRSGVTSSRGSSHSQSRSKDGGFFDARRASRVGGSSMERNRSVGSASGMSSSALTHSTNSLRRPVKIRRENTAASGDTAVTTEPDSEEGDNDDSNGMSRGGIRRDSLILRSNPASRASSPLKEQYQQPFAKPPPVRLLKAAGEDDEASTWWRWRRTVQPYGTYNASPRTVHIVKLVILVAKLCTLYYPCLPSATNPSIALPLLALALFDFVGPPFDGILLSSVLTLIHALVLLNGRLMGADICMAPTRSWHDGA